VQNALLAANFGTVRFIVAFAGVHVLAALALLRFGRGSLHPGWHSWHASLGTQIAQGSPGET
jgi:hypothetical protein